VPRQPLVLQALAATLCDEGTFGFRVYGQILKIIDILVVVSRLVF